MPRNIACVTVCSASRNAFKYWGVGASRQGRRWHPQDDSWPNGTPGTCRLALFTRR
jgi:hypothetical protein